MMALFGMGAAGLVIRQRRKPRAQA